MKDPVEQWLPTAFAVLQQQWAYDFLFSDDEPLLHNALVHGDRVAGTFQLHTDPTLPLSSPCDLAEEGSMLFLSAFNRDVYTAGYEVTHRAKSAQAMNTNHRYISRVIRDDAAAALFTVARHDHLQLTEITFCRPQTPGYRFQAMLMFRTDAFNDMLRKCPTRFDARAARDALVLSFCTSEWRQCPLCASFDSQMCGCALQNRLKHDALDRLHDYHSLLIHSGAFNGVVNISMYAQPGAPPFIQKSARARSFIGVNSDENKQHSLAAWAMQHVSQNRPFNLLRLSAPHVVHVPPAAEQNEERMCASTTHVSLDLDDPLSFLDHVDMSVIAHAGGDIAQQLGLGEASKHVQDGALFDDDALNDSEHGPSLQLLHGSDVNAVSFLSTGDELVEPVVCIEPPRGSSEMAASTCLEHMARAGTNDVDAQQVATSSNWTRQASDTPPSTEDTVQSERAQVAHQVDVPLVRRALHVQAASYCDGTATASGACVDGASRAVSIAPAMDGRVEDKLHMLDANQVKAERRKARNRASAQRSNLKKKVAVQKMKDELSALSEQEGKLRQRERQLREENMKLRSAIPR
ncbi:hypothetical protein BWQ96_10198 [Gracilariopsis chorda]|uniref:BZIP domain-containing protein n=1 Tax=Gracilariopsis chorda TaxID=448386 RepID=A0A2V3IG00_9FLOR|nr:hypothetical protein BWQ96_10198 [Gracilariopsis chorda]|eukprot:PXF40100.1 hypothetical protein BWQ96_10198 [Gracilariopsis chorda]